MNQNDFVKVVQKLGIELSIEQLNKLKEYFLLLVEYNNYFNLTRILQEEDVYLKHFYDSLCIYKSKKITSSSYICDIGTGAGFPGIVLAISNPSLKIDLVESSGKKCDFLKKVKEKLKLTNITIINDRAEIFGKTNREKYDVVTSRAVASLKILIELSIPILKVGGYFIPLKGKIENELQGCNKIMDNLYCNIENQLNYKLPIENSERNILIIKKTKKTTTKYPRNYSVIKNS